MHRHWHMTASSVCLVIGLAHLAGCKPETHSAAQPAGKGVAPAAQTSASGSGFAPASQPSDTGVEISRGSGYASMKKVPKGAPPSPSLSQIPSLADLDVCRFIDLPGVDLPDEPPRSQFEYALSAYELEKINNHPAVVALLKGMDKTYSTTDGLFEVWTPGATVIENRFVSDGSVRSTYFIRNAEDPYEFRFTEDSRVQKGTDQQLVKYTLDGLLKQTYRKVFSHREVSQEGLYGAEVTQETNEKDTIEIVRFFYVNGRYYELSEQGPPRDGLSPSGQKFFDSLRVRK